MFKKGAPCCSAGGALALLLLQVFLKPVRDLLQAADSMLGFAAAAQLVILAPEQAEAGLDAKVLEGGIHLEAFRQPAAVVLFRVYEKGGGPHLVGVLQGRMPPDFVDVGPGGGCHLVLFKIKADVRSIAH